MHQSGQPTIAGHKPQTDPQLLPDVHSAYKSRGALPLRQLTFLQHAIEGVTAGATATCCLWKRC